MADNIHQTAALDFHTPSAMMDVLRWQELQKDRQQWKKIKQPLKRWLEKNNFDVLVQDCSISIANALEMLQFCTKPSIWF